MLTPAQGAITQLWAGTEPGIEEHNGAVNRRLIEPLGRYG